MDSYLARALDTLALTPLQVDEDVKDAFTPFDDRISWPEGEGVVEAVDVRVTRVRTPDNATINVPNTELTANALARPSGRESHRVTETVEIGYDGDTERALLELRPIAASFHWTGRRALLSRYSSATRSSRAACGSSAFATPLASRTPSAPSSSAATTSSPVEMPAPQ